MKRKTDYWHYWGLVAVGGVLTFFGFILAEHMLGKYAFIIGALTMLCLWMLLEVYDALSRSKS